MIVDFICIIYNLYNKYNIYNYNIYKIYCHWTIDIRVDLPNMIAFKTLTLRLKSFVENRIH